MEKMIKDKELQELANLIVNIICGPIPNKDSPLTKINITPKYKTIYKDGEWSYQINKEDDKR